MEIPILRLKFTEDDIKFIKDEIEKVLRSNYLTLGPNVSNFEREYAEYCGVKYALATNCCTGALLIILEAIGVKNSTVIIPSNTYMATAMAPIYAGAKIILTDCDRDTFQMCPDDLETKIQNDTKAVILVHNGGIISPHFHQIKEICDKRGIFLIEDAAHAHGATINGKKAGSLGVAGAFSFYPTKVLTTGEGGMLTTNNEEIYNKAKSLRVHGKKNDNPYIHLDLGLNWAMSEFQAIVGLQQIRKANSIIKERRKIAAYYDKKLENISGITKIIIPANILSSYYKYALLLDENINRNKLKKRMKDNYNISLTGEIYSHPCHTQPVFEKHPDKIINRTDNFPNTDFVSNHHICLPLYPDLKDEEIEYIVSSLKECIKKMEIV